MNSVTASARAAETKAVREALGQGYAHVPFDPGNIVDVVDREWCAFLKRPLSEREQWTFAVEDPTDPDDGFILRTGENGQDRKKFFHYNPRLWKLLRERGVVLDERARYFLDCCHQLFVQCVEESIAIADALDVVLPGYNFGRRIRTQMATGLHKLRCIFYDESTPDRPLGQVGRPHTDKDFVSLHLVESHPGLRFYAPGGEVPYVRYPGLAAFFFGDKIERLTGGEVQALSHGIRLEEKDVGANRTSMVFFAHIDLPTVEAA